MTKDYSSQMQYTEISKVNSQLEAKSARHLILCHFRMNVLANEDVHMQVSIKLDQCLSCQRALAFDQHYTLVL
ncbi:hypothetical protein T06_1036 [Trichinella sp. T6]|nr:hypothetical protein T06_1036 [Trichinella sp. T6]